MKDRAALVSWAGDTIGRGSKSFGLASKLLPKAERENAWLLYAWCRTCDDVTDGQSLGFASAETAPTIDLWRETARALEGDTSVAPAFAALAAVCADVALPHWLIEDHLRGFELDRQQWRPQSIDDLLGYCYHVAGAVGGMMAVIMGVDPEDADTMARASDLGLAFQLNNIARDIVDDSEAGRCYIPAQWLEEAGLAETDLAQKPARKALAGFAEQLVAFAKIYDKSAQVGAGRLPFRCRTAILSAARIYGLIGTKVVQRREKAWDERVSTSGLEKCIAIFEGLEQAVSVAPSKARAGLFDRGHWMDRNPALSALRLAVYPSK